MTNHKLAGFFCVLFLVFLVAGTAPAAEKDVLAKVGNKTITNADLDALISFYPQNQQAVIKADPKNREIMLRNLVTIMAVSDAARRQGFDKERAVKRQTQILTDEHLAKSYIQKRMLPQIKVTDKDVEAYYKEHAKEFEKPETVKARHILIGFKEGIKDEEKKELKKKAEKVHDKAKGGDDFAKLAAEYSDDPGSKTKGGDLGFFARGTMVHEFENAAFALKPGELSSIVETPYGYHIIKVDEKKAAETPAYDSIKEQVQAKATQAAEQKKVNDFIEKAMKDSKVEILPGQQGKK